MTLFDVVRYLWKAPDQFFFFFKEEKALRIVYLFPGMCPPIANAECFYKQAFLPPPPQRHPSTFELAIQKAWIYTYRTNEMISSPNFYQMCAAWDISGDSIRQRFHKCCYLQRRWVCFRKLRGLKSWLVVVQTQTSDTCVKSLNHGVWRDVDQKKVTYLNVFYISLWLELKITNTFT